MREMRRSKPNESAIVLMVFNVMLLDPVDLKRLPLSKRLRVLDQLLRKADVPFERAAIVGGGRGRSKSAGVQSKTPCSHLAN